MRIGKLSGDIGAVAVRTRQANRHADGPRKLLDLFDQ